MRRYLIVAVSLLSVLLSGTSLATAQSPTSDGTTAFAEYPLLTITISDAGYAVEGSVSAGPIHMQVINATTALEQAHIQVVRIPEGTDGDEVQTLLAQRDGQPEWFNANLVGGPDRATLGHTVNGVVIVTAGDYLVTDPFSGMSTPFTVADPITAIPAAPSDETVAVSVDMQDYYYTGLPQSVAAGEQVWKITNSGLQPHELAIASIPPGMTVDQVLEAFQLDDTDPIPAHLQAFADSAKPTDFLPSAGSQDASPGATTWLALQLAPGTTYVAFCFVPDPDTQERHAMQGMISIFTAI